MAGIPVQDELTPMGNYYLIRAKNVDVEGVRLDKVINQVKSSIEAIKTDFYTKEQSDAKYASKTDLNAKEDDIKHFKTWAEYEAAKNTIPSGAMFVVDEDNPENQIPKHNLLEGRDEANAHPYTAIEGLQAQLDKKTDVAKTQTLESRMNQFAKLPSGSTAGDAELADIRVGADGKTYENAGEAVRGQVSSLKETIVNTNGRISNIIAQSGTSDTEVVDARHSNASGISYDTLSDRLIELENYVTPEMFGAKGDGTTNDTEAIQAAIDHSNGLPVVLSRTYLTDDLTAYNTAIIGKGNAILIKRPQQQREYKVIDITGNCVLKDFTVIGDRKNNNAGGEWGHCVNISGNNCVVDNVTTLDAHGDGIYLGGNGDPAENCVIKNCTIDNARRNGISVTNAKGFLIDNCIIKNVHGTDPQYAIDVEPNVAGEYVTGVISNVTIIDCLGGISVEINDKQTIAPDVKCVNITVIRINSRYAVKLNEYIYLNGSYVFDNIRIIDPLPESTVCARLLFYGTDNSACTFNANVIGGSNHGILYIVHSSNIQTHSNEINVNLNVENHKNADANAYGIQVAGSTRGITWKGNITTNTNVIPDPNGFKVYSPISRGANPNIFKTFNIGVGETWKVTAKVRSSMIISSAGTNANAQGMYAWSGYGEGSRQQIATIIAAPNIEINKSATECGFEIVNKSPDAWSSISINALLGEIIEVSKM